MNGMQQVYVKFNHVEQIREFIRIVDKIDLHFDIGRENQILDAKSVIGVFALDLSQPQMLRYNSDDGAIYEKLRPFLCDLEVSQFPAEEGALCGAWR